MRRERVEYEADGLTLRSELFVGAGTGRRPAVLVFPEAFGLGDHDLARAERLAAMGYAALASDLHGDTRLIDELGPAIERLQPLYADPAKTRARAGAGLAALCARPEVDASRVGAIGFCFGVTVVLELALPRRHQGAGRLPQRSRHRRFRCRRCDQDQDPGLHRRQRPVHPAGAAGDARGRDAHLGNGLADAPLRQDSAQLDQPRGRQE